MSITVTTDSGQALGQVRIDDQAGKAVTGMLLHLGGLHGCGICGAWVEPATTVEPIIERFPVCAACCAD